MNLNNVDISQLPSDVRKHFKIEKTVRPNHAQYLNSWIKALKTDYTLIADASAQAQKAVDFFAVK